jgi:Mrp family chromosome partitioning ATPase
MALAGASSGGGLGHARGERSGFKRYYETLRERLWLIAACTVVTLAAAAVYVSVAPRSYTAEAELLINPASSSNTILFNLPVLHTSGDPTRDVLTAASLVTTPQVADAVIRALNLRTTPSDLLAKIQATPVGQSNIVAVQAVASSPQQAQRLGNAFTSETIAVRTAALHAALAQLIPPLRAQVATLPVNQRNGSGSLGDQLSQLEQLQSGSDPTLGIAAPAELPTGPTSPRTKLSLAAGLFAGLLIGIGAAFALSALDPRLRREEQLRELLAGVPVLTRIPRVSPKPKARPLLPEELSFGAQEGYRTLRTTLATRAGSEPQAYLVTGCGPSEGKTTSAIGLAVALAQGGGRVILIEADLRRPTIASALGLKLHYGTEQVLIGEVDLANALTTVTFDGKPLRILAAHRSGVELADRLSFAVARQLIATAKEDADFVVIDSPPLTAVIDALPLAQLADEVLIVVRLGQSRLTKLSDLEELLSHQAAHPTGIVLVGASAATGYASDYYLGPGDHEMAARDRRHVQQELPAAAPAPSRPT